MSVAIIQFTDNADGTLAIDCQHEGEFNPALASHQALQVVAGRLPEMFTAAVPAEPLPSEPLFVPSAELSIPETTIEVSH